MADFTQSTNFLGFRQVFLKTYQDLSVADKKGHLWLVRDVDESGSTRSASIYFGTRKYGEVNDDSELRVLVENLIASLGDMVDPATGEFLGFTPDHEILGDNTVTSVTRALEALEASIIENTDDLNKKISGVAEDLQEAIEATNENFEQVQKEISANTAAIEENAEDIAELDEKIKEIKDLGVFHFVGKASAVSEDLTTIILEDGTEVVANSGNTGDVYVIGHKEFASNGTKWVELGDESEIEQLKEQLEAEIAERAALDTRVAELEKEVAELQDKAEAEDYLHTVFGDDVEEMTSAELTTVSTGMLNNVVANGGTVNLIGDTEASSLIQNN